MLITNKNTIEQGLRKRTIGQEIKIGPLSLQFITIILLAVLALFYLAQSTQSATRNYKLRELEDKRNKLQQESERLEVEVIRLKSLNEIKNGTQSLNLEPIKESGFISSSPSTTARR